MKCQKFNRKINHFSLKNPNKEENPKRSERERERTRSWRCDRRFSKVSSNKRNYDNRSDIRFNWKTLKHCLKTCVLIEILKHTNLLKKRYFAAGLYIPMRMWLLAISTSVYIMWLLIAICISSSEPSGIIFHLLGLYYGLFFN